MSARAQAFPQQAPSISYEPLAPPQGALTSDTTGRNPKIANGVPAPIARPVPASDPLSALKAMTEEERIALFT